MSKLNIDQKTIKDLLNRVYHLETDDINVSRLKGIINNRNLPKKLSSSNKIIEVQNDTSRFSLTSSSVSNGDIVRVIDTKATYVICDNNNLSNNNGYKELTVRNAVNATNDKNGSDITTTYVKNTEAIKFVSFDKTNGILYIKSDSVS